MVHLYCSTRSGSPIIQSTSRNDPPPSAATPPRVYVSVLMRPWVLRTCHATTSCHLGVSRTAHLLVRFLWWIAMDISARWWTRRCLKCQARNFTPNDPLAYPFLAPAQQPRHHRQRRLLHPIAAHPARQPLRPHLH